MALICQTVLPGVGRLSTSAGVAFLASTREPGDLFDRADAAVYDAKARGRGVVSVADMTEIAHASRRRDVVKKNQPLLASPELADARDVITAARGADRHDVQVLIRTAFYTGMRFGELCRVQVDGSTLHLDDTKNGERRSIPAHPRLQTCLRDLPLTANKRTLQVGWERARRAVGMEHVHLHDLRHSAASEMVNEGVDLYTVGVVLGHKDPRSTARYSHHRAETLAAAVGKIRRKSPHTAQEKDRPKAA